MPRDWIPARCRRRKPRKARQPEPYLTEFSRKSGASAPLFLWRAATFALGFQPSFSRGTLMIRTKWLGLALGMALAAGSFAQAQAADSKADLIKRGDYLVNTIMTCGNCHSPKGPQGDIPGKHFSGGLSWDEPPFKVTAPNITEDKETGIGEWSDADIKHLLRTGLRPNGTPIATVMPTGFYGIITDRDLDAIVAYLRTIKP